MSSTLADKVLDEMCNFDWIGFIKVPQVNAPRWPKDLQKKFKRFVDKQDTPWKDYLAFEFQGTTPSGRASQTTVGNTLNSIFYAYYYISKAGLSTDKFGIDYNIAACGDDLVLQFKNEQDCLEVQKIVQSLDCPKDEAHGLG